MLTCVNTATECEQLFLQSARVLQEVSGPQQGDPYQQQYNKQDYTLQDQGDECCAEANPLVFQSDALVVLLLNIFVPGVGSMYAAYRSVDGFNCRACGNGIGQMILSPLIGGMIWSIIQGVAIYNKSNMYFGGSSTVVQGKRMLDDKKNS